MQGAGLGIGSTEWPQFAPVEGQDGPGANAPGQTPALAGNVPKLRAARSERKAKRTNNYHYEQLQLVIIVMVMFGLVPETSAFQDELNRETL